MILSKINLNMVIFLISNWMEREVLFLNQETSILEILRMDN